MWTVALTALVVGTTAAVSYYFRDLTLSHYDAKAPLVVARRTVDSMQPGWMQIGAPMVVEAQRDAASVVAGRGVTVRFLDTNPGWRRCAALPTSAAFRKERNDAQPAEWVDQPFVYWQSPAARFYPASTPLRQSGDAESPTRRKQSSR